MPRGEPQINVRLPADVRDFLDALVRENGSSRTFEVVRSLRERMKAKGPAEAATSPSHDQNHPKGLDGGDDA